MVDSTVRGRVIIVTGASKGVGRGVALFLAANGATVIGTGRKPDALEALSAELDAFDVPHLTVAGNAADREGAFALVALVIEHFGRVDGLVANAQTFRPVTPLAEVTPRDMDTLYDTGPKATLWGMQAVFPHMRDQGWGRIVTMGSNAGFTGAAGYGPYSSSKEAVRSLTRTAAREWGPYGIVVNCVCPVSAAHRMEGFGDDPSRRAVFEATYKDQPIGRDGDAVDDIGPVVAFLLSDGCRYLTGQTLMADGGALMLP
jgi:NAD(P)-dependent dehydrogenase (short-subunit alcohol dehydrogenase family)